MTDEILFLLKHGDPLEKAIATDHEGMEAVLYLDKRSLAFFVDSLEPRRDRVLGDGEGLRSLG